MDIKVQQQLETSFTTSESCLVISDQYLALSHGSFITIYCLDVTRKEIVLRGHKDVVTQLHFIASNILISSSYNSLLSWNLDQARAATNAGEEKIPHIFIGVGLGKATYIATCDQIILLAVKNDVAVLDTKEGNTTFLEGHDSAVVFCHMIDREQIVTVSLDNSMKVWSLKERRAVAQFNLLSSSPFYSFYLDPETALLYLGSCDGQLYVYRPHCGTRVKRLNIDNMVQSTCSERSSPVMDNVISANRTYINSSDGLASNDSGECEIQNTVMNILKNTVNSSEEPLDFTSTFDDVEPISKSSYNVLIVTITSGVIQLNMSSLQLLRSTNFSNILPGLPLAYYASSFSSETSNIAYMDMICGTLTVLNLRLVIQSGSGVSMIQQGLLDPSSPLLVETQWKKTIGPQKPAVKKLEKKGKIRSSGYSVTQSRRELFKPVTSTATIKKAVPKKEKEVYQYPSGPCTPVHRKRVLKTSKTAINCLAYSRDAQYIGTGMSDNSALIMRLPDGAKTYPLIGHKGAITCLKWSTESQVVTTSRDRTAKIWGLDSTEPLINIQYTDGDTKSCKKINFVKEVTGAQFYYLDKFIVLASGASLYLYKYHIEKKKSEVQRYIDLSRYQLVSSSEVESGHTISALCAANAHFSIVTATSDKCLNLFDYNLQCVAMTIKDAHERSIHSVQVVEGSRYVSHTPDTFNIIISSAGDDTKLWDTRSGLCVYSCNKHNSATLKAHAGISTCARYVATPSDDMSVYIYDVRGTGEPVKLPLPDNSLAAQFSPKYPQLAASCVDGSVTFYNSTP